MLAVKMEKVIGWMDEIDEEMDSIDREMAAQAARELEDMRETDEIEECGRLCSMEISEIRERLQDIRSYIKGGDMPESLIIMHIDELLEVIEAEEMRQ